MWRGEFTFELSCGAGWWQSNLEGGMLGAEATFRGQPRIVRMTGAQAILGVCCIRCILYWVYAVSRVSCIRCMLYSVYALHSVNSWSWHGEIQRDDLTLCSVIMVQLWMRKRDGGWRWEWYGGYQQIWEIRGITCLIGFWTPCIGVITRRNGTPTCRIRDGKLTRTQHSLSPSFSWWFPKSSLISLILVLDSTIT